jgi:hypothetical protein
MSGDAGGFQPISLYDSSDNGVTSQVNGAQRALDVGIDVGGVQIDPRQIRALTAADIVTVIQSTSPWVTQDISDGSVQPGTAATKSMLSGGQYNSAGITLTNLQQAALQLDAVGNLKTNIATALPAGTNIIGKVEITDGTNVAGVTPASTAATATQPAEVVALSPNSPVPTGTNSIGTVGLNAGTNTIGSVKITDGTNTVAVAPASTAAGATQAAEVVALSPNSPLPAGTNALGSVLANLQVANAAVTVSNPVPVTITTGSVGTPIQNALTSANLAVGASVTLTYTVPTGHTFSLERVFVSARGAIKAVVQNGSTNLFVAFNSASNPNIDLTVTAPPTIAAAGTVNVIITNEDPIQVFNVYATVEGNQIS